MKGYLLPALFAVISFQEGAEIIRTFYKVNRYLMEPCWLVKNDLLELLFNPGTPFPGGSLMPVPSQLKRELIPWADAFYYQYPFGFALIQRFISRRFSIHFWKIHADQAGMLYPASERPTIALQAMLEGDLACVLVGFGDKVLLANRYELFYVPVSINEAQIKAGDYESFHIEMEPGFLEDIADTYPDAGELLERFQTASGQGIPMVSVRISYVARAIIKNIRTCDKSGGDLVIQLNRCIVDLLSEYISGIRDHERDERRKGIPHKELFMRIKQEILSDPNIQTQNLKKLSVRFGLSVTELKKGFKALFDHTPGAFVRFHALSKAYYLITTTPRGIDDIADEVGYGYRSNFDKAFKKQFGFLTAHLRQKL